MITFTFFLIFLPMIVCDLETIKIADGFEATRDRLFYNKSPQNNSIILFYRTSNKMQYQQIYDKNEDFIVEYIYISLIKKLEFLDSDDEYLVIKEDIYSSLYYINSKKNINITINNKVYDFFILKNKDYIVIENITYSDLNSDNLNNYYNFKYYKYPPGSNYAVSFTFKKDNKHATNYKILEISEVILFFFEIVNVIEHPVVVYSLDKKTMQIDELIKQQKATQFIIIPLNDNSNNFYLLYIIIY